jgi:hypothetical protein
VSFLLDTNVVSEWVKATPNPGLVAWLSQIDEDQAFLSVITLAELRYGIERMAPGRRRFRLNAWLRDELPLRFENRVLPVDEAVADAWGRIMARREARGRPMGSMDALVAATADAHRLTLVTRNVSDFGTSVPSILNPWRD